MNFATGQQVEVGQSVNVPEPDDTDIHSHEFIGTVTDILPERGTIIVEDGDSDFFEIEVERLTLTE